MVIFFWSLSVSPHFLSPFFYFLFQRSYPLLLENKSAAAGYGGGGDPVMDLDSDGAATAAVMNEGHWNNFGFIN